MNKKYQIQDFLEIKFATRGSFSPDGKHIAFLSNLSGTSQLYRIARSGVGIAKRKRTFQNSF